MLDDSDWDWRPNMVRGIKSRANYLQNVIRKKSYRTVETTYKFNLYEETMTIQGFYFLKDKLETKKYPVKFYFGNSSLKTDPFSSFSRYREFS